MDDPGAGPACRPARSGRRLRQRLRTLSLLTMLALFGAGVALSIALFPHQPEAGYYVVDTQRLIEARFALMVARRTNAEQAKAEGERFARDLAATLQELGDSGHLVINKNAAIAFDPDRDLTKSIAKSLDLDLTEKPSVSAVASSSGAASAAPPSQQRPPRD